MMLYETSDYHQTSTPLMILFHSSSIYSWPTSLAYSALWLFCLIHRFPSYSSYFHSGLSIGSCRSTSREVRRLDSVARSPIYSSFTETLDGSSTIRAFQKEGFFLERFIQHVTLYQKTSYSELVASLWLSLRLQLLAGFIILFIATMAAVTFHSSSLVNLGTPGLVGSTGYIHRYSS